MIKHNNFAFKVSLIFLVCIFSTACGEIVDYRNKYNDLKQRYQQVVAEKETLENENANLKQENRKLEQIVAQFDMLKNMID